MIKKLFIGMLCVMSVRMYGMQGEPAHMRAKVERPYFHSAVAHDLTGYITDEEIRYKFEFDEEFVYRMILQNKISGKGTTFSHHFDLRSSYIKEKEQLSKEKAQELEKKNKRKAIIEEANKRLAQCVLGRIDWSRAGEKVYLPSEKR